MTLNVVRAIFPQYGVLVLRYKPAYCWRGALCTVRSWSKYAEGCHLTKTNVVCLKIQYKYLVRRIGRRPCSLRITLHGTPEHSMFRVDSAIKFIPNVKFLFNPYFWQRKADLLLSSFILDIVCIFD